MNNDLLSGLFGALKNMDPSGELQKELESIEALAGTLLQEQEKLKRRASDKEYLEWVYNTVITNGSVEMEYFEEQCGDVDDENLCLLHTFFEYLAEVAREQAVASVEDDEVPAAREEIAFMLNNRCFMASRHLDETSRVSVALLDGPVDECVVL